MSAALFWYIFPLGSTSKVLHSWSSHSETQNKMFPVEYIASACVQRSEEGHKVLFPVLQIQINEHKYEKTWILPVLLGAYPPVHLTTELGSCTPGSFGVSSVVSVSFFLSLSLSLSLFSLSLSLAPFLLPLEPHICFTHDATERANWNIIEPLFGYSSGLLLYVQWPFKSAVWLLWSITLHKPLAHAL